MTARRLTVEIAQQFLEEPQAVDTSRFSQIDDAAAKVFRYREGVLNLDGLTSLSATAWARSGELCSVDG